LIAGVFAALGIVAAAAADFPVKAAVRADRTADL